VFGTKLPSDSTTPSTRIPSSLYSRLSVETPDPVSAALVCEYTSPPNLPSKRKLREIFLNLILFWKPPIKSGCELPRSTLSDVARGRPCASTISSPLSVLLKSVP